jgi:hypothetical protein
MSDDEWAEAISTSFARLSEEIQAANTALETMREKEARWWSFSVSHTAFALVIGEPTGEDNIVLSLGCNYLKGPVKWFSQQIEIRKVENSVVVQDESVGFRAEGGNFRWRRNFDILAYDGLWNRRGPAPPLVYEECMQRIGQNVRDFYDREIGFRELNDRMNAFLWNQLPVLAERLGDSDPRLGDT